MQIMNRRYVSLLCAIATGAVVIVASSARTPAPKPSAQIPARTFEFTYQVHFPAAENLTGPVRLWIPLPLTDAYQDVHNLRIDSPVAYAQGRDPEYKDRYAMFKPTAQQAAAGFEVTVRFVATRREHKVSLDPEVRNVSANVSTDAMLN